MKRIILTSVSVVALSATSPLFAQATVPVDCDGVTGNCSVIEQTGDDLTADVDQDGTGGVSSIDQDGTLLTADVTQAGTDDISNITQDAQTAGSQNFSATVDQNGGADSVIDQIANGIDGTGLVASVTQNGASTSDISQTTINPNGAEDYLATVNQTGDGNSSIITQADDTGGGAGMAANDGRFVASVIQSGTSNISDIDQNNRDQTADISQLGDDGQSFVTQNGTGGIATLNQSGSTNISDIDQAGFGQTAFVRQSGSGNDSDVDQDSQGNNTANVRQDGTDGFATVVQTSNARGETANIRQRDTAVGNIADITQTGDESGDGGLNNNLADIDQRGGSNNVADILQGDTTTLVVGPGVVTSATNALAEINQDGSDNEASVVQGGDLQDAFISQVGDDLRSFVNQGLVAGSGNVADVRQTGTGGIGVSDVAQESTGNSATVRQNDGPGNFSIIDQGFAGGDGLGGDMNSADVRQTGSNNTSLVAQNFDTDGSLNDVLVRQEGDGNFSDILQEGSLNSADVRQFDGSSSVVSQSGTGNIVTVRQGAPTT